MYKIHTPFMIMGLLAVIVSCAEDLGDCQIPEAPETARVVLQMATPRFGLATRSMSPDENLISDLNIFVFSSQGELEDSRYLSGLHATDGRYSLVMDILKNNRYSIYACANIGYKLKCKSRQELEEYRYYLSRCDDFVLGTPMSGCLRDVQISGEKVQNVTVPLERSLARIRLRVDRSGLDKDVEYIVRNVRIVGCPRSVKLFGESRVENTDDLFSSGFIKSDYDADKLNEEDIHRGVSQLLDVYMLENLQGKKLSKLCSYIEIEAMYSSKELYTLPGKYIRYRFYLGDKREDFNVRRNCSYTVTVCPHGNGIDGNTETGKDGRGDIDWRIDKEDLLKYVQSISLDSRFLDFNYAGQAQSLNATVLPADAGIDLLEWRTSNPEVATVNSNGTVTAVGNGSCTITCWSTDGSGCFAECPVKVEIAPAWVRFHNDGYNESRVGESLRVWADYFPPNMKCEIDQEYLDFDVERGIYEYELSEDKSSVVLHFRNPGSGLFHFDVGEPLDTSTMVWVHVYPLDWVSPGKGGL